MCRCRTEQALACIQVGRSLFIGQVFQLLHVKTSNFVTIDSSSGRLVYLSEGGGGSLLRMRTSANNASNLMVDILTLCNTSCPVGVIQQSDKDVFKSCSCRYWIKTGCG